MHSRLRRRPPHCRAVTLIEAVLFIAIALGLIVGGLVFFQQASLSQKVSDQVRSLSAITAETRILFKDKKDFSDLPSPGNNPILEELDTSGTGIDAVLIAAGAVPASDIGDSAGPVTATRLRSVWATEVFVGVGYFAGTVGGAGALETPAAILVALLDVPSAACTRLVTFDGTGRGVFGPGILEVQAGPDGGEDSVYYARVAQGGLSPSSTSRFCGQNTTADILWFIELRD